MKKNAYKGVNEKMKTKKGSGMGEKYHDLNNAFVRSEQMKLKSMAGKMPRMDERSFKMDAYMTNNGPAAQQFAKDLTKGLDKDAFPVNPNVDKTQD